MPRGTRGKTALHAPRGLADQLLFVASEINELQHLHQAVLASETHPIHRRVELHVLPERQRVKKHRLLREIAESLTLAPGQFPRCLSEGLDLPGVGPIGAVHKADRGGLTAPRRTDKPHDRPLGDFEVKPFKDPCVVERFANTFELDRVHGRCSRLLDGVILR